ncbi:MAG: hypothetical protein JWL85_857 [Candidatus Saccharibacteria bacterium]|nr:hypothetical protein [Candidatus Saccharibacteria bacterium]
MNTATMAENEVFSWSACEDFRPVYPERIFTAQPVTADAIQRTPHRDRRYSNAGVQLLNACPGHRLPEGERVISAIAEEQPYIAEIYGDELIGSLNALREFVDGRRVKVFAQLREGWLRTEDMAAYAGWHRENRSLIATGFLPLHGPGTEIVVAEPQGIDRASLTSAEIAVMGKKEQVPTSEFQFISGQTVHRTPRVRGSNRALLLATCYRER